MGMVYIVHQPKCMVNIYKSHELYGYWEWNMHNVYVRWFAYLKIACYVIVLQKEYSVSTIPTTWLNCPSTVSPKVARPNKLPAISSSTKRHTADTQGNNMKPTICPTQEALNWSLFLNSSYVWYMFVPTFTIKKPAHLGKCSSPMDPSWVLAFIHMFFYIRGSARPVTLQGGSGIYHPEATTWEGDVPILISGWWFPGFSVSLYIPVVATLVDKLFFYLSHKIKLLFLHCTGCLKGILIMCFT